MKKKVFAIIAIMFASFQLYASTINWELYTKDHRYKVVLRGTIWYSTIDGDKIIFGEEDGEGKFENGILFGYRPPIFHYNGMSTAPDEPTYYELFTDTKKFNTIRLVVIKGKKFLVDKRGIKYFQK